MTARTDLESSGARGKWIAKGAILQPSGPGWTFKGLGVAKRYCRDNLVGDIFVQPVFFPLFLDVAQVLPYYAYVALVGKRQKLT